MKTGTSMNDYFARTLAIANRMKVNGENKGDFIVVQKILRSMSPKFDYVMCSIEESKDIDTLTIDELQSSLVTTHEFSCGRRTRFENYSWRSTWRKKSRMWKF